jgi:hypothetical protein
MARADEDIETHEQPSETLVRGSEMVTGDASGNGVTAAAESVALRAYRRFEERGGEHGHDLDDWLEAERELSDRKSE